MSLDLFYVGKESLPPLRPGCVSTVSKGGIAAAGGFNEKCACLMCSHMRSLEESGDRAALLGHPARHKQIKEASMSVHVVDTVAAKARSLKPRTRSADQISVCPCASCAHAGDATLLKAFVMGAYKVLP